MATTRFLLLMLGFAVTGGFSVFTSHLLTRKERLNEQLETSFAGVRRMKLVQIALREVGVRERSGRNDGRRVEIFLAITGLHRGNPWCASFVSWVFATEGFPKPRTAWSPDLFPLTRLARSALPGDVLGIYFTELRRIAHVGIVERMDHEWCLSIEGNTSLNGGRSGDGVYRKRRHIKTISKIADWVSPERRSP